MAMFRQSSGIMRGMRYWLVALVGFGLAFWSVNGTVKAQTEADWDWTNKPSTRL